MPRYEFSCPICGQNFEKVVSFKSNLSSVVCPNGHHKVRRIYSAVPIVYKSGGFYSTDHRSGNSNSKKSDNH